MKRLIEFLHERGVRIRSLVYAIVLIGSILIVGKCREIGKAKNLMTKGETMGTFYQIYYIDDQQRNLSKQFDSILNDFNQSLSTYIEDSELMTFNNENRLSFESDYFLPVLQKSKEVYEATNGYFDPSVGPLVKEWGFGYKGKEKADSAKIDSILTFVGFDKIQFDQEKVWKDDFRTQLDFSAIAKGYGVDVIAAYLETMNIKSYFINIGGEIRAAGLKPDNEDWRTGVENPVGAKKDEFSDAVLVFSLLNKAVATSGDYRNYKETGENKYGHTINPLTGFPAKSDMLSVSVLADDCMTADAYATAFMSMGSEKAIALSEKLDEVEVYLIYEAGGEVKTYTSEKFKKLVIQNE